MPRRLGSTVPATVSRLLQGGLLSSPPAWYEAVGTVAPLRPSLTKRTAADDNTPSTSSEGAYLWKGKRHNLKPAQLKYRPPKPKTRPSLFKLHDEIRQMFHKDHPFEAFRGTSLIEEDKLQLEDGKPGPKGKEWRELRQRSINPSPEDVIDFVVNLHQAHSLPIALSYSHAIAQFRSIRASYEVMLQSAQSEREAYGGSWPTEFSHMDRLMRAEDRSLKEILKERRTSAVAATSGSTPLNGSGTRTSRKVGLLEGIPRQPAGWTAGAEYLQGKRAEPQQVQKPARLGSGTSRVGGAARDILSRLPSLRSTR